MTTAFESREFYEWEREGQLLPLAKEYHERCEAYDRNVCTGGVDRAGDARPANAHELGIINRHAMLVRRELNQRAAALGFSPEQLGRAIRKEG
jgi:hypothetical protein